VNAINQSVRYNSSRRALGENWVIVTLYVPALVVSSALILMQFFAPTVLPQGGHEGERPRPKTELSITQNTANSMNAIAPSVGSIAASTVAAR
jgi:hypothetical protein